MYHSHTNLMTCKHFWESEHHYSHPCYGCTHLHLRLLVCGRRHWLWRLLVAAQGWDDVPLLRIGLGRRGAVGGKGRHLGVSRRRGWRSLTLQVWEVYRCTRLQEKSKQFSLNLGSLQLFEWDWIANPKRLISITHSKNVGIWMIIVHHLGPIS